MRKLAWPAISNLSHHLLLLCICVLVFQTYVQGHNQHHIITFLRHSTSVECLSAIALRSSSVLANQNVSMDLISQSRSDLSVYQFTPSICMCLYTRRKINTRSQNSFWYRSKMHCFQCLESSEKYHCLISVSILREIPFRWLYAVTFTTRAHSAY